MTNKKLITQTIDSALSAYDFKKKSDNWFCHKDETVLLVNLQKSNYGGQFYLNCGVLIKALSNVEFPKEENCHIRFRLHHDDIGSPESQSEFLLDLENESITDDRRVIELTNLINSYVIPILEKCSTIKGVSEIIKNEKYNNWGIRKNVRDFVS